MKNKTSFSWLLLPIVILSMISAALFIERSGISYSIESTSLGFLDPIETTQSTEIVEQEKKCLVLYSSDTDVDLNQLTIATDTLDSMRVNYDVFDVHEISNGAAFVYTNYETIVITFFNLDQISQQILGLARWVENGGRMLFTIRPEVSESFIAIYRKLGIVSYSDEFKAVPEIQFTTDLFPGMKSQTIETGFENDSSLSLQLENNAHVHLASTDRSKTPILWDYDYGQGRFVVINSDQFVNKYDRGVICAAYSLLYDTFIYPVINSSMVFIDDFPDPIPEGINETIYQEFGRDIESFYINVWWPDMKDFARRYGLKYTGLLVETYNEKTSPPFIEEKSVEQFEYFGSSLLAIGGEIGLHGYNHIPFVTDENDISEELGYPVWPSEEAMQISLEQLYTFGISLFPEQKFTTYVPPSNILSSEARAWIPKIFPEIKVISSHYLPVQDDNAYYMQEFEEAADGIIEVPRIVSGYEVTPFLRWTAVNELVLHYVNSQFIHPDDVMDEERSAGNGWGYLRDNLEQYLIWLESAAPSIRQMTASEGGMAVQRFARLALDTNCKDTTCTINLSNFYDEAWMLMHTSSTPIKISGGTFTEVTPNLYLIGAESAQVEIIFEE
jgi:hypothetical protein